ncbi:MAG: hypothetical protein AAB581_02815 [Patescibacteria group bacterium]
MSASVYNSAENYDDSYQALKETILQGLVGMRDATARVNLKGQLLLLEEKVREAERDLNMVKRGREILNPLLTNNQWKILDTHYYGSEDIQKFDAEVIPEPILGYVTALMEADTFGTIRVHTAMHSDDYLVVGRDETHWWDTPFLIARFGNNRKPWSEMIQKNAVKQSDVWTMYAVTLIFLLLSIFLLLCWIILPLDSANSAVALSFGIVTILGSGATFMIGRSRFKRALRELRSITCPFNDEETYKRMSENPIQNL